MSVLTIRAYRRYATRLPVALRRGTRKTVHGLLIELAQQGARVSNLERGKYEVGDDVTIISSEGLELEGFIRWAHDGLAGITLNRPLHLHELRDLLELSRSQQSGCQQSNGDDETQPAPQGSCAA